ncbi:sodium/potassium/calcium exchanger 3-like [Acropora millepora]|uniref:sodium/potassium/calcium exchanger 3-like n=1 Tax=Acropora millepora TaxID=45264 RepID=UPI001CF58AE8|nr:sodium/potassium/calcium exchanger 3-like [Acropora millepora]
MKPQGNYSRFTVLFAFMFLVSLCLFQKSTGMVLTPEENTGRPGFGRVRGVLERSETTLNPSTMAELEVPCAKPSMDDFPGDFMSQDMRAHGGIAVHIILALYMFVALAILSEKYFVPSVEKIGHKLNLSKDVCGGTLMAMGTSGTELFTSVIGIFITKSDIGLATVAGSTAFNVLGIVGICGLSVSAIRLSRWPFLRDNLFNLLSVTALTVVTYDRKVYWYEALGLLFLYFVYVIVTLCNERLKGIFMRIRQRKEKFIAVETELTVSERSHLIPTENNVNEEHVQDIKVIPPKGALPSSVHEKVSSWILWGIALPFTCLYYVTIPDCRKVRWEGWFLVTFFVSLVWMALLTYVLVWMLAIIGFTCGIPDTVMGLTLLAAGTSLPDTFSSFIVARKGEGDMAVSHANGSNMFNILFCLGLPWFLQTALLEVGSVVTVRNQGINFTVACLFASVVIPVVIVVLNKWYLNKCLGIALVPFYLVFIIISVLLGMNVFGQFSLKMCSS